MERNKEVVKNIEDFCTEIVRQMRIAVVAMQLDMENTLEANKEEIVIFNEPHAGFIGVSYIENKLRFIKGDGTTELASNYDETDFDDVLLVWYAFHNDSE